MRNPWEVDWSDPAQAQQMTQRPQTQAPLIQGPPRQPPPRYDDEAMRSNLGVREAEQNLAVTPQREARDAERFENERGDRRHQRIREIRTEFNGLPEVRTFRETRNAFLQMQELARSVPDDHPGRAQADTALVYAFMRALDPASTVREGEFAQAQSSAGLPERFRVAAEGAMRGERLSPEMRAGMVRATFDTYIARARSYNGLARQYQPYFQELGEDPNRHIQIALGPERAAARAAQQRGAHPNRRLELFGNGPREDILDIGALGVGIDPNTGQPVRMPDAPSPNPTPEDRFRAQNEREGRGGSGDLLMHGAMLGLSDEASGLGGAVSNMLLSPFTDQTFDPLGQYTSARDAERMRLDDARQRSGWLGTGAEVLGGLASARPGVNLLTSAAPTLGGRVGQGARVGSQQGAIAGAGYADSPRGQIDPLATLTGAGIGAGIGAGAGALLPAATAGVSTAFGAGRRALGYGPQTSRAPSIIADAIQSDANTPFAIGREMQRAQGLGVPYMLADSGDNVRGLLAASTRSPGPGRTLARDALEERQEGLADRVTGAIQRDLGPTPNIDDAADELLGQAQTAAAPLYEAAYARPGADVAGRRVSSLLARPSMRRALGRAHRIAAEEGRDPTTLGFELNAAGEVTLTRVPSWQTLDYVKRGMDDVVESYRDPVTGRLRLDTEGRAINNTLRSFLGIVDQANPEYAAARAAYAGPVRARSAMEAGRRAITASPDDIHRTTRDMTPGELEFFRTGVRRAMADAVSRRGDSADTVNALIGTPARRTVLSRLFGGRQEFDRFIDTLRLEREGHLTYRRATQGSPTAQNLQDDAALGSNVGPVAVDMMTSGMPIATGINSAIRAVGRARGNRAANNAREDIAALLSETDPARLAELGRGLMREAARRRAAANSARRRGVATSRVGGNVAGQYVPPLLVGPR